LKFWDGVSAAGTGGVKATPALAKIINPEGNISHFGFETAERKPQEN